MSRITPCIGSEAGINVTVGFIPAGECYGGRGSLGLLAVFPAGTRSMPWPRLCFEEPEDTSPGRGPSSFRECHQEGHL